MSESDIPDADATDSDTSTTSIRDYYTLTRQQLYERLCSITHDLTVLFEQQAFLQSQELEQKMVTWLSDPEASIQARDRAASYSAGHITSELYVLDGNIRTLQMERSLI